MLNTTLLTHATPSISTKIKILTNTETSCFIGIECVGTVTLSAEVTTTGVINAGWDDELK